jgi:paraquat-inducible protein B
MSTLPSAKVSRRRSISIVWVVPIIALAIGAWMGLREIRNLGPKITIEFADGSGVEAGKTILEYKGIGAGSVQLVAFRPDMEGVILTLRLRKNAASLAKEGSKFWILHPEIGLSGVRGLETLVTGVRLNVMPGTGPAAYHFVGLEKTPAPDVTDEGRSFVLRSDRLGSLTTGAPVYYRELKVGAVEASRFSDDATSVLIRLHIEAPYVPLVRTNTRFWNTGGFSFKVSLFGATLKDTSLESLITGGVSFATPDTGPLEPAAEAGAQFELAAEAQKEWTKWSPHIPVKSPDSLMPKANNPGILPALIK